MDTEIVERERRLAADKEIGRLMLAVECESGARKVVYSAVVCSVVVYSVVVYSVVVYSAVLYSVVVYSAVN